MSISYCSPSNILSSIKGFVGLFDLNFWIDIIFEALLDDQEHVLQADHHLLDHPQCLTNHFTLGTNELPHTSYHQCRSYNTSDIWYFFYFICI